MDELDVERRYEMLVRLAGAPLASSCFSLYPYFVTEEDMVNFFQDRNVFDAHLTGQSVERAWEIFLTFKDSLATPELRKVDEEIFCACFPCEKPSLVDPLITSP
jgi:hypothetical protein